MFIVKVAVADTQKKSPPDNLKGSVVLGDDLLSHL